MAVGVLLAGEAITEDSYKQLTTKMFGNYPMRDDQSPDGLLIHTAGQSEQGWYVYDIWESPEDFQRFVDDTLGPAAAELMPEGPNPEPVFYPIETLVEGPALAI